ncbi:MAG: hypothetical protein LAO21_17405 [Acidobacteriia bacterium]|nr:hypothetical protein [Terriglobia bacterium]
MADLKLNDVRKYAIEQGASIFLKSASHDRAAEVSCHGIVRWVRTDPEEGSEWLLAPVSVSFDEILAVAEEFVVHKPQAKPSVYTRERFTALLAPQPGAATSSTHAEDE